MSGLGEAGETASGVITLYTDGGCSGNPGKGGWAYVLNDGYGRFEDSGAERETTNNRMELRAVIAGLGAAERSIGARGGDRRVEAHTDSQYVKNGITVWIARWKANGWRTASKEPVKNRDLWTELDDLAARLSVSWHWVKGHAGNELNEECDRLVQAAIKSLR
jgi:ribonuclease HI